jgi:acetyltransferase
MLARIALAAPKARIEGFILQEMVQRPGAYELILGMAVDATFGPFVLFGQGGTAVEVIADKALALPPLNIRLAQSMIADTRIYRQLLGYRDRPRAALDAIASALVRLSQLIVDHDEIVELDINPLLVDAQGAVAVDARVKLAPSTGPKGARLAIRPYPRDLEHSEEIAGLGKFRLRPVRPEDAPAFTAFFGRLSQEDVRLRFFSAIRALPETLLIRLTQIDYDRQMAFVLFDSKDEIAAVARIAADPDNQRAEFAIVVRSDLNGKGIGSLMMQRITAYAKVRGIGELFGDVLADNVKMLALCRRAGGMVGEAGATPGTLRVSFVLQ